MAQLSVPILMYHRIDLVSHERNTVVVDELHRQLAFLQENGYTSIGMEQLHQHWSTGASLPSKSVVITFDDGYQDNHQYAMPLLLQHDMKAIVFPVASLVGGHCNWRDAAHCEPMMNWTQLREWQAAGLEIGGHTYSHASLDQLSDEKIQYELQHSKQVLEDQLGTQVDCLCYPYGNFDDRAKFYAAQAGYQTALGIFERTDTRDLFALPRLAISSRTKIGEFKRKVSRLWPLFVAARRLERYAKQLIKS